MSDAQPNISAEIVLRWGDGKLHLFALKLKEIEALQRSCNAGMAAIGDRLLVDRRWYACDIVETLRLGLIGGGMPSVQAQEMIEMYVDGRPLADPRDPANHLMTAQAVFSAAYFGIEKKDDEPAGKDKAATVEAGSSTSRPSTAKRSRSGSRRSKSAG